MIGFVVMISVQLLEEDHHGSPSEQSCNMDLDSVMKEFSQNKNLSVTCINGNLSLTSM